jgi:hypothetical protein
MANPLSQLDEAGDLIRKLVRHADEPLAVWPPTDEQLLRLAAEMDAPKPRATMDRLAGVISRRGLENVGTIKDVEASMIGLPSNEPGPAGVEARHWIRSVSGFPKSPDSTPVYVVDPIKAVASQYPEALREEAIATARKFQMPLRNGGSMLFQMALSNPNPKSIVLAYPGRQSVEPGAAGLAHAGVAGDSPGLVEVAAGRQNSQAFVDRVLLHELRHTLEGGGMGASYSIGGYQDWRAPRSVASARKKQYLGSTGEEVARFGDARARYAQHSGRLIADDDEAEYAARLILENQHGLGDGFYAPERVFYRAAREADPNIRAHQNRLLQGLLSVPGVVAAGATADE